MKSESACGLHTEHVNRSNQNSFEKQCSDWCDQIIPTETITKINIFAEHDK